MRVVKEGQFYVGVFGRYHEGGQLPESVPDGWWFSHGSFLLEVMQTEKFLFTYRTYKVLPNGMRIEQAKLKQARKSELAHEVKMHHLVLQHVTFWQRLKSFFFGPDEKNVLRLVEGKRNVQDLLE